MPRNNQPRNAQPTSFRLSPQTLTILAELKKTLGFNSRDDIIELALRELAHKWLNTGHVQDEPS